MSILIILINIFLNKSALLNINIYLFDIRNKFDLTIFFYLANIYFLQIKVMIILFK